MEMSNMKVGRRFAYNSHLGTVHYEGFLEGNEGIWLGVEWDDPSRGKHDGINGCIRYFQTRHPTSGSFIRPDRVDFGITYVAAVLEKYRHETQDAEKQTVFFSTKPVELIGMDQISEKQSHLNELKTVSVKDMKIYGSDSKENLENFTPNVMELDLSNNLFMSWQDIAYIVKYMKNLSILDLSENRLNMDDLSLGFEAAFQSVQELKMIKMEYDWNQIVKCLQMMPDLRSLIASNNKVSSLHSLELQCFQQLEELNLCANNLSCWNEVLKLGMLPKLTTLDLNNCGLETMYFSDANSTEKSKMFPSLQVLRLSDNDFKNWRDISELDKLSNFVELRMINNPVCYSNKPETVRQLFIAKIGQLKMLNRVQVTSDERRGAELDYLKKYGQVWLDIAKMKNEKLLTEFGREHPRYEHLVKKHGAVEASELKQQSTNIMSKTLALYITSPKSNKTFDKKIPYSMTVQKFKQLLRQLFKSGNENLTVSYISSKHGNEITLDNDLRTLSFFSIEDGDKIVVNW